MPGARLNARLRRLERNAVAASCPACRARRGRVALRTWRQLCDGTTVFDAPDPPPCGLCGQVAEEVIEILEVVVSTQEQAARWQSGEAAREPVFGGRL